MRRLIIKILEKIIELHQRFYVYVGLRLDILHTKLVSKKYIPKVGVSKEVREIYADPDFDQATDVLSCFFTNGTNPDDATIDSNIRVARGTCGLTGNFRRSDCPK
jgi:hypothetical protein